MYEIRMHGLGGQGIVVGGEILSNAFLRENKYLAVFPSFGVERRGSAVTAFGRLDDKPIREKSKSYEPDFLIICDPSQISVPQNYEGFKEGGVIVACGTDPQKVLEMGVKPKRIVMIDGIRIAYETTRNSLTNMIMCGAFARATDIISFDSILSAIREELPSAFVKTSVTGAQRGHDEAQIYDYDVVPHEINHTPRWENAPMSCKLPPVPKYEAPWGDFKDHYMVVDTGAWRSVRPVIDKTSCVKCGICATFCPLQCLSKDDHGFYEVRLDFCKGCGVCAHECPRRCIAMKLEADCE